MVERENMPQRKPWFLRDTAPAVGFLPCPHEAEVRGAAFADRSAVAALAKASHIR